MIIIRYFYYGFGILAALLFLRRVQRRLELSLAKHRSLAGHPRMARRLARLIRLYEYDESVIFSVDGAPDSVRRQRADSFRQLAQDLTTHHTASLALTQQAQESISDLQFTARYRVPFQFRSYVRRHLGVGAFVRASAGVKIEDLDGNEFYDLAGSYGVNLFGYDFYKSCIDRASACVHALGPVLGFYHPIVADNVTRLRAISGLDEVSFHMSGTEAVMQAVRLARYHTGRTHVVRFCGAYHGWWGDVQPGIGNPIAARDTYTLKEMSAATLRVLRTRRDIACVLVNPLQALHPNREAPSDSTLIDGSRSAGFDRAAYTAWLRDLRQICRERNIPLIFDEVFVGFRLAPRGAQEYFGIDADMVTYGKTLGGGLPIGVLCGRKDLMRRFREEQPADICFARGTFNSHPYIMASMHEFLTHLDSSDARACYAGLDERWNGRALELNEALAGTGVPVRVANLSSIFTVRYTEPSRYHWLLQYYLRAHGLALSWVGTGRLIFSLNYTDADFDAVIERFVAAARAMHAGGWWWTPAGQTHKAIRRRVLRELLMQRQ